MEATKNNRSFTEVKFYEYTRWNKGQHFISMLVKSKEMKKQEVAARIYMERGKDSKAKYYALDVFGNRYEDAKNLVELKNLLKRLAPNFARDIAAQKELAKAEEKVFQIALKEEQVKRTADLKELRNEKTKDKDKTLNR